MVGDVGGNGEYPPPGFADGVHRLGKLCRCASYHRDTRFGCGQRLSHRAPKTASAAGYDGDLPCQINVRCVERYHDLTLSTPIGKPPS